MDGRIGNADPIVPPSGKDRASYTYNEIVDPALTQSVTVQKGGKIVLVVPSLAEGSKVDVVVSPAKIAARKAKRRGFGADRDKIRIAKDFDAALDDFNHHS